MQNYRVYFVQPSVITVSSCRPSYPDTVELCAVVLDLGVRHPGDLGHFVVEVLPELAVLGVGVVNL